MEKTLTEMSERLFKAQQDLREARQQQILTAIAAQKDGFWLSQAREVLRKMDARAREGNWPMDAYPYDILNRLDYLIQEIYRVNWKG